MTIPFSVESVPLRETSDGMICVGGTRIPLDTVIGAFHAGATAEEIAQQYPSLDLADVYHVIGYYLRRRPEVDAYLSKRATQRGVARQENESRHDPAGVRERLLARRAGRPG